MECIFEKEFGGKPMHVTSWLLCLWPGLARSWTKGDWPSLALAITFGAMLNLALVTSFKWPELLGDGFPTLIWPILAAVWIVSAMISHHELFTRQKRPQTAADLSPVPDTLFIQAQREYLRGNWADAESLLKRRLQFRSRDVESRLLLATLLRHRYRFVDARVELDTLARFDESEVWKFELERERQLLELDQQQLSDRESAQELQLTQNRPLAPDAMTMESRAPSIQRIDAGTKSPEIDKRAA
jgi:hypothetical protein